MLVVDGDVSGASPATTTTTTLTAPDEWQLVSRGASKKKKKKSTQRSGDSSSTAAKAHAHVGAIAKSSSASTGYKYKAQSNRERHRRGSVDAADGSVSQAKQSAIQERVARVVLALRESALLLNAVRVIDVQFQLHSTPLSAAVEAAHSPPVVVHLVCYGLGSFCSSSNAVYQLAYAKALLDALRERVDTETSIAEIFDPVMSKSDVAIAEHFGFSTIQQNECGKRTASAKTVFFMPHCGKTLYQNVLASNWAGGAAQLTNVIVIGNSFEAYSDRLIRAAERKASVLVAVLPYLRETELQTGLSKSHDEFVQYEAAFNDLSIHVFPAARAQEALLNAALTRQMAAIADEVQTSSQSEELIVDGALKSGL